MTSHGGWGSIQLTPWKTRGKGTKEMKTERKEKEVNMMTEGQENKNDQSYERFQSLPTARERENSLWFAHTVTVHAFVPTNLTRTEKHLRALVSKYESQNTCTILYYFTLLLDWFDVAMESSVCHTWTKEKWILRMFWVTIFVWYVSLFYNITIVVNHYATYVYIFLINCWRIHSGNQHLYRFSLVSSLRHCFN